MALLIGPGGDLDAEPGAIGVGGKRAGKFYAVDDAERAVEPAAIGLGFAVRADEQPTLRTTMISDDVADAVNDRDRAPPRAAGRPANIVNSTSTGE